MDWDFKVPLDLSVSVTFSTKPRASESDEHIINEEEIIDEYFKMGIR